MSCPCKQTHGKTLACERCLEGHLGYAAVTAREFAEDPTRIFERRLTLGNLKAAEWHASALGRPDVAAQVREARHRFAAGDSDAVVALLGIEIGRMVESSDGRMVEPPGPSDHPTIGPSDQKGGEF